MAVPPWTEFMGSVLKTLAEAREPVARRSLKESVVGRMNLSAEDLAEMAGSTNHTKAEHRAAWALAYASMAGLAESPRRGFWQLTNAGRAFITKYPHDIPEAELQKISRARSYATDNKSAELPTVAITPTSGEATPDERFREAHAEIRQSVRAELLGIMRSVAPNKFETLVLDVLHAMGYGQDRTQLQTTAAGADGGIDGVISLDRLGLEKVYVQAKRYAEDNAVSRPTIQAFLGALAERRATKGVFITTSRFSKEAHECAARSSDSLVLVNGETLAELMLEYRVGVSARETFTLLSVDGDYFEGE